MASLTQASGEVEGGEQTLLDDVICHNMSLCYYSIIGPYLLYSIAFSVVLQ